MFGEVVVSSICLFESSPLFREMIQFDEHVFLDGLVPTPTRKNILDVFLNEESRNPKPNSKNSPPENLPGVGAESCPVSLMEWICFVTFYYQWLFLVPLKGGIGSI